MVGDGDVSEVEAEIGKLIEAGPSNADLLAILGEEDGALFASPSDKMKRGLRFLRNAIGKVRDRMCANEFIRAHGEDTSTQRKALAIAAMLDYLGTKGAASASVLIVQIGLENVCAGHWEQHARKR
jgi:hypothetical protein